MTKKPKIKPVSLSSADVCTPSPPASSSEYLEVLADEHAAGNRLALFEAIRLLLAGIGKGGGDQGRAEGARWAYTELSAALKRYSEGKAKDLGEAFGISRPKGWRSESHQALSTRGTYKALMELMANLPKTPEGFETAGEQLGMSRATAERLYYRLIKTIPQNIAKK